MVALLAEGVGRNKVDCVAAAYAAGSPSSRRAWVEIGLFHLQKGAEGPVALLAEGVGRNRQDEIDRNIRLLSPSSRRAWVEISSVSL